MIGLNLSVTGGRFGERPALALDFAGGQLPAGVAFTRASTATYFDASGVMQTAAVDEPAFDHDPVTGQPLGLAVWGRSTNLLLWSEDFTQAAWIKSDTTFSGGLLIESATTGIHTLAQNLGSWAATTAYTFSADLKAEGRSRVRLQYPVVAFGGAITSYDFDLASGSLIGGTAGVTGRIKNLGGGKYRCSITATSDAGGSGTAPATILLLNESGVGAYAGDGVSGVRLYRTQLEASAFPTPYIKTEGSTATRIADSVTMTGTAFSDWFNPVEGTFAVEFSAGLVGSSNNYGLIGTQSTGYANSITMFAGSGRVPVFSVQSAGTQAYITNANLFSQSEVNKFAAAYRLNDFAASPNGFTTLTDTSGTIPAGLDKLYIGSPLDVISRLNGHIRSVRYWPTRLSNTRLQELTA